MEDEPVEGTPGDPALFSGKRRAPRKSRTLDVEVRSSAGVHAARTVDISRGGMLLELTDPEFRAAAGPPDLVGFASLVSSTFPSGMDVSFGEGAVRARAQVVRVLAGRGPTPTQLIGCRFEPRLEFLDCRLLGVEVGGDEADLGPSVLKAWQAAEEEGRARARALVPGRDELLHFIQNDDRAWDGRFLAATATALPPDLSARVAAPVAPPDPRIRPKDASSVSAHASLLAGDSLAPATFERAPDESGSAPDTAPPSAPVAPGTVVAHLFAADASTAGAPIKGRVLELRTRGMIVDVAAPAGTPSPLERVSRLGSEVLVLFLREGRALWETRARVQRLMEASGGVVVVSLLAAAEPPASLRRAFAPPPPPPLRGATS